MLIGKLFAYFSSPRAIASYAEAKDDTERLAALTFTPMDKMESIGWVPCGVAEIAISGAVTPEQISAAALVVLRAEREQVVNEFATKLAEIDDNIQKFLAIEG